MSMKRVYSIFSSSYKEATTPIPTRSVPQPVMAPRKPSITRISAPGSFPSSIPTSPPPPAPSIPIPISVPPSDIELPPPTMAADKLESEELVKLLEIIDKLREFGVSEDISLPQLVVVGDQSSGKSSLLEALTGVQFPVASTLCTRFATQISFRRSFDEKITVSLIPSQGSDDERKMKLRSFSDTVDTLTSDKFMEIMERSAVLMGLPKPGEGYVSGGARFSDDVLKIELCGPSRSHFSVVDIPGLFQSATIHQTEQDAEVVETLAKRYIQDTRTIILAVASSLNETANQKVFRLAKEADPRGIRTVGVLTKPDAIQPGDEGRVIDTARNRITVLNHGWFVVRNRSTEEVQKGVSIQDRQANERRFFMKDPWRTLDKDRVGIPALEKFLRKLLFDHIRKEYPSLVQEIGSLMERCRKDLEDLGPRRESSDEQRRMLIEIATEFQSSAKNSMMGFYEMDCLTQESLRVRMHIQNLNEDFSNKVLKFGHTKSFDGTPSAAPETENAFTDPEEEQLSIHDWIKKAYYSSRGAELPGMVNPGVVQLLFKMQTVKWEKLARNHIARVKEHVEKFNIDLLRHKCPDDSLRQKIWIRLRPMFADVYKRADAELASILDDERGGILLTYNHYYAESLDGSRKDRLLESINSIVVDKDNNPETTIAMLKKTYISNEQQAVNEIQDVLQAFYKVARKRFVDCVALQVIERHFLGPSGPIRSFSPSFIGTLSPEELRAIAGEEQTIIEKRKNLTAKLTRLQGAQEIANTGYW